MHETESGMEISVIIAYYDNLLNLEILLAAFNRQSFKDFELIVAEDNNDSKTLSFLDSKKGDYFFPILHVNQEEKIGFRKTTMLNKAVRISNGNTLVFTDADCIPHRQFLKEYKKNIRAGEFLFGRRVLLGKKTTGAIYEKKPAASPAFFSLLFSDSTLTKEGLYWPYSKLHFKERKLSGCNWGIRKDELVSVNGFDEDYVRPGVGEDHDIEWRLKSKGLKMKSMKNRAIVYHLYHLKNSTRDDAHFNDGLMEQKKEAQHVSCLNGMQKLILQE